MSSTVVVRGDGRTGTYMIKYKVYRERTGLDKEIWEGEQKVYDLAKGEQKEVDFSWKPDEADANYYIKASAWNFDGSFEYHDPVKSSNIFIFSSSIQLVDISVNKSEELKVDETIVIKFSDDLDFNSISQESIQVSDFDENIVPLNISYSNKTSLKKAKIEISPKNEFEYSTYYQLKLIGIKSINGIVISEELEILTTSENAIFLNFVTEDKDDLGERIIEGISEGVTNIRERFLIATERDDILGIVMKENYNSEISTFKDSITENGFIDARINDYMSKAFNDFYGTDNPLRDRINVILKGSKYYVKSLEYFESNGKLIRTKVVFDSNNQLVTDIEIVTRVLYTSNYVISNSELDLKLLDDLDKALVKIQLLKEINDVLLIMRNAGVKAVLSPNLKKAFVKSVLESYTTDLPEMLESGLIRNEATRLLSISSLIKDELIKLPTNSYEAASTVQYGNQIFYDEAFTYVELIDEIFETRGDITNQLEDILTVAHEAILDELFNELKTLNAVSKKDIILIKTVKSLKLIDALLSKNETLKDFVNERQSQKERYVTTFEDYYENAAFSIATIELLNNTLDRVNLITPSDKASFQIGNISFSWSKVVNATSYEIQFNSDEPIQTQSNSFTLLTDASGNFEWKVKAKNSTNESLWSEIRSFSINKEDEITSLSTNTSQSPNSIFQVDVTVGSESDPVEDLYDINYVLTYDQSVLEYVSSLEGDFLGNHPLYQSFPEPSEGKVTFVVTKKGEQVGSKGTGIVSSATFKVNPNVSFNTKTTITLTEVDAENSNQQKIPFTESEIEINISTGIEVWPGDTNIDGKVDNKDVGPIARNWKVEGPVRENASLDWKAQFVTPWTKKDSEHADADGDGIVGVRDIRPIARNWNKKRNINSKIASKEVIAKENTGEVPLSLINKGEIFLNNEFTVSIVIGNQDSIVTESIGSYFNVNYEKEYIGFVSAEKGDFYGDQVVPIAQDDPVLGEVGVGIERFSGSSSGSGIIYDITFELIKEIPTDLETIISFSDVEVLDTSFEIIPVVEKPLIIKSKPSAIVTFSLPDTTALLSNEITLPLTIANPDGGSFSSFQIELDFDQAKLELINVEKGELLDDNYSVEFNSTPSSDGLISGQGTSDVNTSGNLLHLTFKAVGSGTYGIDFQDILLNEGTPAANSSSGSVNVAPYVCGDTNGDGIVTPSDASDILRHTVLITPPYPITGVDSSAADVTGNGMITAFDGAQILKFDVKLIDKLNCGLSNQKVEPVFVDVDFGEYSEESNKILVPLTVKGISGDISSLEFSFKLSNGISNISLSNIPESWNLSSNTSGENIYFSLYGINTLTEDTEFLLSIDKLPNTNGLDLSGDYRINENAKENFVPLFIDEIPNEISLNQNYPNPFNPTTNISFSLPEKAQVKLVIYSTLGQKVATLVDKSVVAGSHTVTWEAQNNASGIYFYRLFVDDVVKTQKMLLIK